MEDFFVGTLIPLSLWLVVITFIVMLVMVLLSTVFNIKTSWKSLAGFGVVAILAFIFYNMGAGEVKESWAKDFGLTAASSKLVDGGILLAIAMVIITAIAAFFTGIFSWLRNILKF